jgi:hypothetical protein
MRVTDLANKLNQKLIKMEITKEQILKIVDQCFHYYASSFRNEARQEATDLIEKHELAISVTRCCTELCDCAILDPIDPFAEVDKDTCRKCNNLIA